MRIIALNPASAVTQVPLGVLLRLYTTLSKKLLWNKEESAVSCICVLQTSALVISYLFPCTTTLRVAVRTTASCMDWWSSALLHAVFTQWRKGYWHCSWSLFVYLFIKGEKKADIFKKQIVTWRVLWIIAFSFLAYGTNWISGEVGWELPFKRNLLLVGLANCLAHIKEGKQAVTLHFIYIHNPYTVQIDYC